jgi:hypothetical protein
MQVERRLGDLNPGWTVSPNRISGSGPWRSGPLYLGERVPVISPERHGTAGNCNGNCNWDSPTTRRDRTNAAEVPSLAMLPRRGAAPRVVPRCQRPTLREAKHRLPACKSCREDPIRPLTCEESPRLTAVDPVSDTLLRL